MDVVRHEYVTEKAEVIFPTGVLENLLKDVAGGGSSQDVSVAVAADGDEVQVSGVGWQDSDFEGGLRENGSRSRANNPPFAMKPQRMGPPSFVAKRKTMGRPGYLLVVATL